MDREMDFNPEEKDELIELIDEEGESTLFEHLGTFEFKGETYLAVTPATEEEEEDDDEEDMEVFILKIETDENGEDIYTVPDDEIADQAFAHFLTLVDLEGDDEE